MTSPAISTADRDKAKELCEAATPGPWQTRFFHRMFVRVREAPGDLAFNNDGSNDWRDCEFIAFSRTAIPSYEARVVELEAALKAAESEVEYAESRAHLCLNARDASDARATALLEALNGKDPDAPPEIRPLSWLRSLLDDARSRGPEDGDEDPDAWWTMLGEVEELYRAIRTAIAAQQDRQTEG